MSNVVAATRRVEWFTEITDFCIIFLSVFILGIMTLYYNIFTAEIESYLGIGHSKTTYVDHLSASQVTSTHTQEGSEKNLANDSKALAQIQWGYQEITTEHFYEFLTYRARSYDLAFNTLPPGKRLIIDSIGVDTPIVDVPYASNEKLEKGDFKEELKSGVVKYPFTSKPGEKWNTLLFGHSSVDARESKNNNFWQVFAKLPKITEGDIIKVIRDGQLYTYEAMTKEIKWPKEVWSSLESEQQGDEHLLTLMACYPILSDAKRILVTARLREPKQLSMNNEKTSHVNN